MSITLTRFSQEVDVATGSMDVTYFAVFRAVDGRELKLPISQQASQELISFMADKPAKVSSVADDLRQESVDEMVSEEDRQFATTFGDEDPPVDEYADEDDSPISEEEVPSL
jgi:hypothetical protein